MLTIFSVPKPFVGHIATIQRNAIRSWSCLRPRCEIILFGDEPGIEEAAVELGVKWIGDVARSEYGTPLLNSVFEQVERTASYPLACFVNTDVILMNDLTTAAQRLAGSNHGFLMAGQRWDLDVTEPLPFGQDWEQDFRGRLAREGRLHPQTGSDYFVFPIGSMGRLPAFAVGRPFWDNWFIYRARSLGVPVIDATRVVTVVHQSHGYQHVPAQRGNAWMGPEADRTRELIGDPQHIFTLLDATHIMTPRSLVPALGFKYLRRRCQTLPVLVPGARPLVRLLRTLRAHARRLARLGRFRLWMGRLKARRYLFQRRGEPPRE
jgi:hypothetical protein